MIRENEGEREREREKGREKEEKRKEEGGSLTALEINVGCIEF